MWTCFSFPEKWGWVGKRWHHKVTRRGSLQDSDAPPVTKREMTLCCITLSHVFPELFKSGMVCISEVSSWLLNILLCAQVCPMCPFLCDKTEAECNSRSTHHNIYSNQAANAAPLHSSQFKQSISPTSRRAEPTCYRIARFASTIQVFFLTPSAHFFSVAAGLTRVQEDAQGVGWENQLTGTPLFCSQPHTQLRRGEQLLGKRSGSIHKHWHAAVFFFFFSFLWFCMLSRESLQGPCHFPLDRHDGKWMKQLTGRMRVSSETNSI